MFALPERALWIPTERLLAVGDLHVGYESAHRHAGALIPRTEASELVRTLEALCRRHRPETVVVNGDLKHTYRAASHEEREEVGLVCRAILPHARLVVVEGNHDHGIAPLLPHDARLVRTFQQGGVFFTHGHLEDPIPRDARVAVFSHEHPALTLTDAVGAPVRIPVFLSLPREGLVILPAMSRWAAGVNALAAYGFHGPLLAGRDPAAFEAAGVTEGEVLPFGTVGALRTVV